MEILLSFSGVGISMRFWRQLESFLCYIGKKIENVFLFIVFFTLESMKMKSEKSVALILHNENDIQIHIFFLCSSSSSNI